jgi:hypothetical protein
LNSFTTSKCDLNLSLPGVFALALGKDLICRVPKEDIHQASKFAKCEKTLGEQARTPRKKNTRQTNKFAESQRIQLANKQVCRVFFFAMCMRTLCRVFFCTRQIGCLPSANKMHSAKSWFTACSSTCK